MYRSWLTLAVVPPATATVIFFHTAVILSGAQSAQSKDSCKAKVATKATNLLATNPKDLSSISPTTTVIPSGAQSAQSKDHATAKGAKSD